MDILATAASIGLSANDGHDGLGTIEEELVLATLSELALEHPGHDELFAEASVRVQMARSAGVERLEPDSVFAARRTDLQIQLRYRSEMLDVFTDLAIDVGVRAPQPTVGAVLA